MRKHDDPVWGQHVRAAGLLEFPKTPGTDARHNILKFQNPPFKGCSFSAHSKLWVIKLYLGGEQRTLASFRDSQNASRFADMALAHFWKYRKTNHKCDDQDLNYGLAQVQSDRENFPASSQAICQLEGHLIQLGVFKDHADRALDLDNLNAAMRFRAYRPAYKKVFRACNSVFVAFEGNPDAKATLAQAKETLRQLDVCMQSFLRIKNNNQ